MPIMRLFINALAVAFLALSSPAIAGDLYTMPSIPLCDTPEHLKEYLLAAFKHDERWVHELADACPTINGGLKAAIIEDLPSESSVMHVVKVRVFSPYEKGSATGYTVNLGLTEAPTGTSR
jgi:hypothetical protein